MTAEPDPTVFEESHFRVFHCLDVDVPGYLIVAAKDAPEDWGGLDRRQQARLGVVVGRLVEALKAVVAPERVYVCSFGESSPGLHLHLFPRYRWMTADAAADGRTPPIDGPALLSRIRRERACAPRAWADAAGIADVVRRVRERLADTADALPPD